MTAAAAPAATDPVGVPPALTATVASFTLHNTEKERMEDFKNDAETTTTRSNEVILRFPRRQGINEITWRIQPY